MNLIIIFRRILNIKNKKIKEITYVSKVGKRWNSPVEAESFSIRFKDGSFTHIKQEEINKELDFLYKYGKFAFDVAKQKYRKFDSSYLAQFLQKNKQYEQSKKLIEKL